MFLRMAYLLASLAASAALTAALTASAASLAAKGVVVRTGTCADFGMYILFGGGDV